MKVIDLDILRPEPQFVKIGGREIDISFIPCGIHFDVSAVIQELMALDQVKLSSDIVEMKNAFGLSVKLCAIFCQHLHKDMTEEWFYDNATTNQINDFVNALAGSLLATNKGIEAHAKN